MQKIITKEEIEKRVKELAEAISVDHVQSNNNMHLKRCILLFFRSNTNDVYRL